MENSPDHSNFVSINERSIVEVLCKLQIKLQITKEMNVILHLNWVRATFKSILHQPLRGAVDVNDRKLFNIECFERRFAPRVILTRTNISRASRATSKENLYLVNSKQQPRGYTEKYLNFSMLYNVHASRVTKQEQS